MQSMGSRYGDADGDGELSAAEIDAINAYADANEMFDGDPATMGAMINKNTGPAAVDNPEDDVTRGLSAAQLVLGMTEKTMPGDIGHLANTGMGEGKSIWDRMAMLIQSRSLALRILMDAHDRRNRGFVEVSTFRRSLCYPSATSGSSSACPPRSSGRSLPRTSAADPTTRATQRRT